MEMDNVRFVVDLGRILPIRSDARTALLRTRELVSSQAS